MFLWKEALYILWTLSVLLLTLASIIGMEIKSNYKGNVNLWKFGKRGKNKKKKGKYFLNNFVWNFQYWYDVLVRFKLIIFSCLSCFLDSFFFSKLEIWAYALLLVASTPFNIVEVKNRLCMAKSWFLTVWKIHQAVPAIRWCFKNGLIIIFLVRLWQTA